MSKIHQEYTELVDCMGELTLTAFEVLCAQFLKRMLDLAIDREVFEIEDVIKLSREVETEFLNRVPHELFGEVSAGVVDPAMTLLSYGACMLLVEKLAARYD